MRSICFSSTAGARPASILLAGLIGHRPRIELRRIAMSARDAGLGRRALQLVLERSFRVLGADLVLLDVLPHNTRALRAYAARRAGGMGAGPDRRPRQ